MTFKVRLTRVAEADLDRLFDFQRGRELSRAGRDLSVPNRALAALRSGIGTLKTSPFTCRKAGQSPFLRDLIIPFDPSGSVALFGIEDGANVAVLAVRHRRGDVDERRSPLRSGRAGSQAGDTVNQALNAVTGVRNVQVNTVNVVSCDPSRSPLLCECQHCSPGSARRSPGLGRNRDGRFVGIAPAAGCGSARSASERHPLVDNRVGVTGLNDPIGVNDVRFFSALPTSAARAV